MIVATMPGAEPAILKPGARDHRHQLVAVDDLALLVDDQHAVGVAVERDSDIGAQLPDLRHERRRMGRADIAVDVEPVGLVADGDDLGAELPEGFRRHLVTGAVGAIEHDAQAFQAHVARHGTLGKLDIARIGAVDALGPAELRRGRQTRVRSPSISPSISRSTSSLSL